MPIPNSRSIYQNLAGVLKDIKSFPFPQMRGLPRGTIVTFQYASYKHDPQPIVIVTEAWFPQFGKAGYIQGVNLNYVVLDYFVKVVLKRCGDPNFGYFAMKNNSYLRLAFRKYKWTNTNVLNMRYLDCNSVKEIALQINKYDPANSKAAKEAAKKALEQQMQPTGQPKAAEMQGTQPGITPQAGIAPTPGIAPTQIGQ